MSGLNGDHDAHVEAWALQVIKATHALGGTKIASLNKKKAEVESYIARRGVDLGPPQLTKPKPVGKKGRPSQRTQYDDFADEVIRLLGESWRRDALPTLKSGERHKDSKAAEVRPLIDEILINEPGLTIEAVTERLAERLNEESVPDPSYIRRLMRQGFPGE